VIHAVAPKFDRGSLIKAGLANNAPLKSGAIEILALLEYPAISAGLSSTPATLVETPPLYGGNSATPTRVTDESR
jgi:hypothetical protein